LFRKKCEIALPRAQTTSEIAEHLSRQGNCKHLTIGGKQGNAVFMLVRAMGGDTARVKTSEVDGCLRVILG
jgi:hypothetical protein